MKRVAGVRVVPGQGDFDEGFDTQPEVFGAEVSPVGDNVALVLQSVLSRPVYETEVLIRSASSALVRVALACSSRRIF